MKKKHEWRKHEKNIYVPKPTPEIIEIPSFKYFTISGKGNPNDAFFSQYIEALYALSYGVRMSYKKGIEPKDFYMYTVYPLEGIWDISEEAKQKNDKELDKNDLVFKLMIRQPDFVDKAFASKIIALTKQKKENPLLDNVIFEDIKDGKSIQMLHLGSYDDEPESFKLMEEFAKQNKLTRVSKVHREIYLNDARKVSPEKLKTVLRFKVN